jgi:type II secretory pathway pseudopilin PulG
MVNTMKKLLRNHRAHQNQSGFSTLEILLAVALLVISFSSVIMVVMGGQKLGIDTQTNNEALRGAEKYMEEARVVLRQNFSVNNLDCDDTLTTIVDCQSPAGFYKISRRTLSVSECAKDIKVRYDWAIEGRSQNIELVERITDPAIAVALGGDCIPTTPPGGNTPPWVECRDANHADVNPSGSEGTDISMFHFNGARYAFITSQHSNNASDDVWLYDVSDIDNPIAHGHANIAFEGAVATQVVRDQTSGIYYAYVLTAPKTGPTPEPARLVVLDVSSDVENLTIVGTPFDLGPTQADAIYYYGGKLYIAQGTNIVVVQNLTTTPAIASTISLGGGAVVNKIVVQYGYIFAATADNNGELKVINIATSQIYTKTDIPGNNDGTSIFVSGGIAYLGRDSAGNVVDLMTIDVSNPPGGMPTMDAEDIGHNTGAIIEVIVNGGFAFLATTDVNDEFEVWDVRNPYDIKKNCVNSPLANDDGVNLPNIAGGMDFIDNIAFGVIRSNAALRFIIDPNN